MNGWLHGLNFIFQEINVIPDPLSFRIKANREGGDNASNVRNSD